MLYLEDNLKMQYHLPIKAFEASIGLWPWLEQFPLMSFLKQSTTQTVITQFSLCKKEKKEIKLQGYLLQGL